MEKWLNTVVKNNCFIAPQVDPLVDQQYKLYYSENDTDVKNSDNDTIKLLEWHEETKIEPEEELLKKAEYIEEYKTDEHTTKILINRDTYRYHVNNLFKELVNFCIKNKLKYNSEYLMNPKLKETFYKFCYVNTY